MKELANLSKILDFGGMVAMIVPVYKSIDPTGSIRKLSCGKGQMIYLEIKLYSVYFALPISIYKLLKCAQHLLTFSIIWWVPQVEGVCR